MSNQSKYSSGTPTSNTDLSTVIQFAVSQMMMNMHTVKVCTIIEQTDINAFTVQPAVSGLNTTGEPTDSYMIYAVPSAMIMGGVAGVIIDYQVGDLVMVGCCDRNSDAALGKQGQANPQNYRKFSHSDAIIIGKVPLTLPTTYVHIKQEQIELAAPTKIMLTSPEVDIVAGTIKFGSSGFKKTILENVALTANIAGVQGGPGVSGVTMTITNGGSSVVSAQS